MSLYVPLPGALRLEKLVKELDLDLTQEENSLSKWIIGDMNIDELKKILFDNKINYKLK